jgi:hypothetical protein
MASARAATAAMRAAAKMNPPASKSVKTYAARSPALAIAAATALKVASRDVPIHDSTFLGATSLGPSSAQARRSTQRVRPNATRKRADLRKKKMGLTTR